MLFSDLVVGNVCRFFDVEEIDKPLKDSDLTALEIKVCGTVKSVWNYKIEDSNIIFYASIMSKNICDMLVSSMICRFTDDPPDISTPFHRIQLVKHVLRGVCPQVKIKKDKSISFEFIFYSVNSWNPYVFPY
jgi:hypothetical protein